MSVFINMVGFHFGMDSLGGPMITFLLRHCCQNVIVSTQVKFEGNEKPDDSFVRSTSKYNSFVSGVQSFSFNSSHCFIHFDTRIVIHEELHSR